MIGGARFGFVFLVIGPRTADEFDRRAGPSCEDIALGIEAELGLVGFCDVAQTEEAIAVAVGARGGISDLPVAAAEHFAAGHETLRRGFLFEHKGLNAGDLGELLVERSLDFEGDGPSRH